MKILFRADASTQIGSGHIMRCLTLADALQDRGETCHFICQAQSGNLIELIRQRGYPVQILEKNIEDINEYESETTCTFFQDADFTRIFATKIEADWIVVDHYQLGNKWEQRAKTKSMRLLAIDDLGREHDCDLLLDQNFNNPAHAAYIKKIPADSEMMLGPNFALVGRKFSPLRTASLNRRNGLLHRILVTLGGSDEENGTYTVLEGLRLCWRNEWTVDVVIGANNPHIEKIKYACKLLPSVQLHIQTTEMAALMTAADFAITAGGSTTWERCTLGLPALVTALSDDQVPIARLLGMAGAHQYLGLSEDLQPVDYAQALAALTPEKIKSLALTSSMICDGLGANRVAGYLQ